MSLPDTSETRLLACVVNDPYQLDRLGDDFSGDLFENPAIGQIFDMYREDVAKGLNYDAMLLGAKLAEWGVPEHVATPADIMVLCLGTELYVFDAPRYAEDVRNRAIKRGLSGLAAFMQYEVESPFETATKAHRMLTELLDHGASSKITVRELGAILDEGDEEYDWLIPGLLERGDRFVLTGFEGQGKSYLLRQIAICAAAGLHPFNMAHQIEPLRVMAIDAENTERQWRRGTRYIAGRAASFGMADPRSGVMVSAGFRRDLTKASEVAEIHRLLDRYKPDMLLLAPLYKMVPKEITNEDDASPLIVTLDSFRERGITLLIEAHAGKKEDRGGERNLAPRGSSALMGWPEFGLGLRPLEDDPTMATLVKWRGDREEREWPRHIRRGLGGELPWMPA